jgi:hypothetical protein
MKPRDKVPKSVAKNAKRMAHQHWRSKAAQVSAHLLKEIHEGRWSEWLPSERKLCKLCHVGRNTMRTALAKLSKLKVVERRHGIGTRIIPRGKSAPSGNGSAARTPPCLHHDLLLLCVTEDIPTGYGVCKAIIAAEKAETGRRVANRGRLVPVRAPRGMRYLIRL